MGARELLVDLAAAGFTVTADGDGLVISPWSKLTADMRGALWARKSELLDLLCKPAMTSTRCADCQHLLRHGTCAEPVAAGLLTVAEGFGIVWPPAGYANTCASYSRKPTAPAQERPYSLTKARGGTAHAEPWDDAAMARFQARAAAIQRRGFGQQDAEDLAEQLHLRDVQAAHRIYCLECRHLDGSVSTGLRCGNHRFASVGRDLPVALVTMAQVCSGFSAMPARVPMADDATQPSTR